MSASSVPRSASKSATKPWTVGSPKRPGLPGKLPFTFTAVRRLDVEAAGCRRDVDDRGRPERAGPEPAEGRFDGPDVLARAHPRGDVPP
jgi:hypothetical protein